ncbi:MAG: hypothetical protein WBM35_06445 [Candidatus Electrothrix sp.]
MLSSEELQYLIWLTAEVFEGWGSIVDLGPWLGSSSAALAEGLKIAGRNEKVSCFDLFTWDSSYMEIETVEARKNGEDFFQDFLRETREYNNWIVPLRRDLTEYVWDGGPIEILFVDAAKTWELTNAIIRGFGAYLVPGRSRIILQDFRWPTVHWLPLIFDSRPDLWEETESTDYGTTVTFTPLKPLFGPSGIHDDYSEHSFPLRPAELLFQSRFLKDSSHFRHLYQWMLYRKYLYEGSLEKASVLRGELDTTFITSDQVAGLDDISCLLVSDGWDAYNQKDFERSRLLGERILTMKNGQSFEALPLLGMSHLQLGDLQKAGEYLREAISKLPENHFVRLFCAELAILEERLHEAENDVLAILRSPDVNTSLAEYSLSLLTRIWKTNSVQSEYAIEILSGIDESTLNTPVSLTHLADCQIKVGQVEKALENIKKALQMNPDNQRALELQEICSQDNGGAVE